MKTFSIIAEVYVEFPCAIIDSRLSEFESCITDNEVDGDEFAQSHGDGNLLAVTIKKSGFRRTAIGRSVDVTPVVSSETMPVILIGAHRPVLEKKNWSTISGCRAQRISKKGR